MKTYLTINWSGAITGMVLGFIAWMPAYSAMLQVPAEYPTIQAAVNVAQSGDEVHITAGVYKEQVVVTNKILLLTGEPGTVVMAWTNMVSSSGDTWHNLFEFVSADVTVKGIDFEGEELDDNLPGNFGFAALFYRSSGGRVENCVLRGFRGKTRFNKRMSVGVTCFNPLVLNTNVVNLEVVHNTFADNGGAMWITGDFLVNPTLLRVTVLVEDNTVTGNGPSNPTDPQQGIQIEPSVGGTIRNNRISNLYYSVSNPIQQSWGILAYDSHRFLQSPIFALQSLRIENNVLVNNQNGLGAARCDNCQILDNCFEGGTNANGLGISGTNVTISLNQFTNLNHGVVLFGDDPAYGTNAGVAHSVAVIDNRFCSVVSNLVVEPLVTDVTEQGTLICPFPPPKLDIAPAVLLYWPDYAPGWTLQSAPTVDGPWTPFNAAPIDQDGRYTFAVRCDAQHRFFRLRAP